MKACVSRENHPRTCFRLQIEPMNCEGYGYQVSRFSVTRGTYSANEIGVETPVETTDIDVKLH